MSKRKDPRLAEASTRTAIPPAPPTAEMQPPARGAAGNQKTKVKRSPGSRLKIKSSRPNWFKPFCVILLGAGLLYFFYSCVNSINATLAQNQRNATITDVWRQLLIADTRISGSPTNLDENGVPSFPHVGFNAAKTKADLDRGIRLSTALPGIQSMDLSPESTRTIGRGVADDDSLILLANNYTSLDTLSISGTRITTLEPLSRMTLRELRIVNTPIKREKLATLEMIPSITDLWLGWEPDPSDREQEVFSTKTYKLRLVESLARMPNLKNVYLFNLSFDSEDLKKLPKLNIKNLR